MTWTPSTPQDAANIFDAAVEAYVRFDSAFRYTLVNRATEQLLGKGRADLLGRLLWEVYPELIGTAFEKNYRRAMAERVPVTFEDYYAPWQRWYASTVTPDSDQGIVVRTVDITDRKRAEDALQMSEAQFRDLFESAPVAYHELDRDGVIRRVNRAECALLGYEAGDMLGRPIWEFVAETDREASRAAVLRKLSGEQPLESVQRRVVRRDGGELYLEVHDVLVRNPTGDPVGIRSALLDITDRKLAELEARAAHAELAVIHAHAPVVFLVVDDDLRIQKVNETAIKLAGRLESEMLGLRPGGAIGCLNSLADSRGCGYGPSCGECAIRLAVLDTVQNGNQHDNIEAWLPLVADGDAARRCLLVFTAPLEVHGKRNALVSVLDITSRKQTEQELRTSEARFRTLTEDAPIAISMSRLGRIVYANPMYLQMFGFHRAEELNDRPTIELFAPQCRDEVTARAQRRAQGLPVPREYEAICRRGDGSEFPAMLAVFTMQFAEGPALVAFITDLTSSKQAEEERMRLEQQFRQAQKMESIGRLAGGVAHDFNNLLTVINGYSRMLLAKLSAGDPMRDNLSEIHKAGERAAGLTRQLLAFSRKQVLEPRRLDVNRVLAEMRPMLERLVGEDVEVHVAPHAEVGTIHADLHQLEQVVMNLVVNARDAMSRGGKLRIETAHVEWDDGYARSHPEVRAGRYVMLTVSDTGVGMDEETRRQIFEPFFTTKEPGKGTGLGLSMVQGIVAQSGGHIDVFSEPGQGTTFKIYLPALDGEAVDDGMLAVAPELGGKETVLVVEDQAEVRNYAVAALKAKGYRAIPAENAGEALLICEREHIDLVLTDVVMPHLSGRELAERLETLQPGVKVLFMSGYTDKVIQHHEVLEQLIHKPFSPEQLAGKVRAVLGPPVPPAPAARILVADDEAGVRGFLRTVLEGDGCDVIEAADGRQVLRESRAGHVDLVITDLVMPEQEGIETIQALRREVPGARVIAISGAFGSQYLKTAQLLGADAVLSKPVSPDLLLTRVAEVLKLRR
jgi:PAS domain S-box-containing protein